MKFLVVFLFVIPTALGWVEWKNVSVKESALPITLWKAWIEGWRQVSKDNGLKIWWFMRDNDPGLLVAYDKRDNLAGIRINQLQNQVRGDYLKLYKDSQLFHKTTLNHNKYFSVTFLFTPPSVLKNGGRQKLPADEVALSLYVKRGGRYEQLHRDGCDHDDTGAVEQGCRDQYGLVFSDWDSGSRCGSLSPFYTLWDTRGTGNLIGCGILTFTDTAQTLAKPVDKNSFKSLFPRSPSCLEAATAAEEGLGAVEVLFTGSVSLNTSCPSGDWSNSHCDRRRYQHYIAL